MAETRIEIAVEIVSQRFRTPPFFKVGYSADAVDDFLDSIVVMVKSSEDLPSVADRLEGARFVTSPVRGKYDMSEVDAFLEHLQVRLRETGSAAR